MPSGEGTSDQEGYVGPDREMGALTAEDRSQPSADDTGSSVADSRGAIAAGAGLRKITVKAAYVVAIGLMVVALVGIWQDALTGTSVPTGRPGTDFAVFYSTALLVVEGNGSAMYEPAVLGARIAEVTGYTEVTSQGYRHPPVFSLFFLPLTVLPFAYAYLTFLVAGGGALAMAASRVGFRPAGAAVGLALVSVPGFWTVQLGQMGLWVSALMLAIFLSLRAGHHFRAGLLLGLLVFKPLYAVGIGVWWLIGAKRYAAATAGAAASAALMVVLGFAIPGGWDGYLALLGESGGGMIALSATSGFSIFEMWMLVVPGSLAPVLLWAVSSLAVVVASWLLIRRLQHRIEPSLALAVVMGLLISPRTGWYDWVLLVVPGVLLWRAYPKLRPQTVVAGAWLYLGAALSWMSFWRTGLGIDSFQFAPLVLVGVTWWWFSHLVRDPTSWVDLTSPAGRAGAPPGLRSGDRPALAYSDEIVGPSA